jgi:hypothetical protein
VGSSPTGPTKLINDLFNIMNDFGKRTIQLLMHEKILTEYGPFVIDERLILKYVETYSNISGGSLTKIGQKRLARKLAGLNLMTVLNERKEKYECGFVYVIANPAWPEHLKIGMTIDTEKRLASYQTNDPFRQYFIKHYEFVPNRREIEKSVLNKFNFSLEKGEWVKNIHEREVFEYIQNQIEENSLIKVYFS